MKKCYAIILLSVLPAHSFAQPYVPMLDSSANRWTFIGNVMPVRAQQPAAACDYNNMTWASTEYYTVNDTVIGTETYKTLYVHDAISGMPDCLYGYLREDTAGRKVYFVDNVLSPPVLIYDFSMQVGDSIHFDFSMGWGGYYQTGYYFLDSIGTITVAGGPRRIFYLNQPGFFTQYPMEWIESVGHPGHLVLPYSLNFWGGGFFWCNDPIARDFYNLLTCFEHDASKVYFDSCSHSFAFNNWCFNYVDSCNYWNVCGSLDESGIVSHFGAGPVPGSETVTLFIDAARPVEAILFVRSMSGKTAREIPVALQPGRNEYSLPIQNLPAGLFLLELRLPDGVLHRKLVKK